MISEDREYYRKRAEYHRRAARSASTEKIAALHAEIAERYLAIATVGEPPTLRIVGEETASSPTAATG